MADAKKRVYVTLKGLCKWAKVLPGQEQGPMEIKDGNQDNLDYSIQVECSEVMYNKFIKAGVSRQTELRTDDETGKTYINLKAAKQRTGKNKKLIVFPDLKVIDINRKNVEEKIGNGSTVLCIVELANVEIMKKAAKALRLKCVQVLDHIIYDDGGADEYEHLLEGEAIEEEGEGWENLVEEAPKKVAKKVDMAEEFKDDEIPDFV